MVKTTALKVRFEDSQYQKLERHAQVRGVPLAVIIRELVDALPDSTEGIPVVKIVYEVKK